MLLRDSLVYKFITSHSFIHQRTQTALNRHANLFATSTLNSFDTNSEMGLLYLLLGPVKSQFFHKQPNTVNHMTKQNTKAMLRSTWVHQVGSPRPPFSGETCAGSQHQADTFDLTQNSKGLCSYCILWSILNGDDNLQRLFYTQSCMSKADFSHQFTRECYTPNPQRASSSQDVRRRFEVDSLKHSGCLASSKNGEFKVGN